ncbi:MAG: hypothetical protein KDK90_28980 [Leptospiraceae bacterium]|nr:hypothetical protein [Leptospiraceae bacterium]
MKTITLNIPDEIAQDLNNVDLVEIFKMGLALYKTKEKFELLPIKININDNKKIDTQKWKQELLKMSVWTEEEIQEIENARDYINQWKPKQFA